MIQQILDLINSKKLHEARQLLVDYNTVDLADALESLDHHNLVRVFRMLSKDAAADVFSYMSRDLQMRMISAMTDQELRDIMDELFLDDAVDLIEEMPANVVTRLLRSTDRETRSLINHFLQYPDASAGSIMTIEFVDLRKDMTVHESFEHIRQKGVDKETIYTCYVTDAFRHLLGLVSVRTLLLSDPEAHISEIMDEQFISVKTLDDQEEVARLFDHYDLLSLPVVDNEQRLVGIITIDDVLDVIQEENTEDFVKMAAVLPSDVSYLETNVLIHARRRMPWLLFLMVSAIFTGAIITTFEKSLEAMPALIAFIPMLMGTGGNSGAQAATLVIRGMALDELRPANALRIAWKELRISLMVGAFLAVINMIRIILIDQSIMMALTVSLSLYATVIMAKMVGSLLPLAAQKMKLDPAIMASPVITTLVDAGSLIVFFLIARLILRI